MSRGKFNRVKTAKGRKQSSTIWLQRHINDPYVIKAKEEGYRSRAAFKLSEIEEKFKIISNAKYIVDLGAAPGGWSQFIVQNFESVNIIAVDLIDMQPLDNVIFIQDDFTSEETQKKIINLSDNNIDLILSDMSPNTTGHSKTDHLRIIDLAERVFDFSKKILSNGGNMVFKIFQGGAEKELLESIKNNFEFVKHFKPKSSRKNSSEIYLIAKNFIKNS